MFQGYIGKIPREITPPPPKKKKKHQKTDRKNTLGSHPFKSQLSLRSLPTGRLVPSLRAGAHGKRDLALLSLGRFLTPIVIDRVVNAEGVVGNLAGYTPKKWHERIWVGGLFSPILQHQRHECRPQTNTPEQDPFLLKGFQLFAAVCFSKIR